MDRGRNDGGGMRGGENETGNDVGDNNTKVAVSGSASTVVTFTVENLLYTALLTAICWFVAHYFPILRIPAIVFMFIDSVSVMASVHAVSTILIFSIRPKRTGGAFSDCVLAEISQGFAVISSLMWLGFLWCMFLDVPRIAAVSGHPSSASAISVAVVLGFSIVIPFLALVVTYAAVPSGAGNSLVFNGSTVGAACLLFFVMISFGSGGVTKCAPYGDEAARLFFCTLVLSYWCALLVLEVIIFVHLDIFESVWVLCGNNADTYYEYVNCCRVSWIDINVWRIFGCVLNVVIVSSAGFYIKESQQQTLNVVLCVVFGVHVPMILTINVDLFHRRQMVDDDSYSWDDDDGEEQVVSKEAPVLYGTQYNNNSGPGNVTTYPQVFPAGQPFFNRNERAANGNFPPQATTRQRR